MANSKNKDGKTPNGGVRSTIFYRDSEGNLVDEKEATAAEIVEYDADGKEVGRTYGSMGKRRAIE